MNSRLPSWFEASGTNLNKRGSSETQRKRGLGKGGIATSISRRVLVEIMLLHKLFLSLEASFGSPPFSGRPLYLAGQGTRVHVGVDHVQEINLLQTRYLCHKIVEPSDFRLGRDRPFIDLVPR